MEPDDHMEVGLDPAATIDAFVASCKRDANRLFITVGWFGPFRDRLLKSLPPALPPELVDALRDALYKRRSLHDVVDFVEQQPMSWDEFESWRAARDRQLHATLAKRGFFPWEDVEDSEQDHNLQLRHPKGERPAGADSRSCPGCGMDAESLAWFYFSSPSWTWEELCGRAGWIAVCKPCRMQVNFVLTVMN